MFEENVGRYGFHSNDSFKYIKTRIDLVMFIFNMADSKDSREGVELALKEALEVIRLDQMDLGLVRFVVSIMFLMLDRDQEAFDFIKWHWGSGEINDLGFFSSECDSNLAEGEWPRCNNHDMYDFLTPYQHGICGDDGFGNEIEFYQMPFLKVETKVSLQS